MKILKNQIKELINSSGFENKKILIILDEIRKDYHNRRNVGDKGLSLKKHSKLVALIRDKTYTLSLDRKWVFYKGGWKKIIGVNSIKHIIYLGSELNVKFKINN